MDGARASSLPLTTRIQNYAAYYLSYLVYHRNGTVNRRLLTLIDRALVLLPNPTPRNNVVSSDHVIDPNRNLWYRIYSPAADSCSSSSKPPLIVYFHGGGFVSFSPKTAPLDAFCRRLAADLPAVVVSVNYRLAPEHRFPSPYDDGFDALRHIDAAHASEFGDLGRCFLAGDSSGANLAHHVAVQVSGFGFRRVRIRGMVSVQPFFGGEERTGSEIRLGKKPSSLLSLRSTDVYWKAFLPAGSDRNHPASRVFGPGSGVDLAGIEYPPTLVFVGGRDLLQDWQREYTNWLAGSGKDVRVVEYPNMFHGFYAVPRLPESSMLVCEIGRFIGSILGDEVNMG